MTAVCCRFMQPAVEVEGSGKPVPKVRAKRTARNLGYGNEPLPWFFREISGSATRSPSPTPSAESSRCYNQHLGKRGLLPFQVASFVYMLDPFPVKVTVPLFAPVRKELFLISVQLPEDWYSYRFRLTGRTLRFMVQVSCWYDCLKCSFFVWFYARLATLGIAVFRPGCVPR